MLITEMLEGMAIFKRDAEQADRYKYKLLIDGKWTDS